MSNSNYTLDIISHHPQFDGKSLRQYYVNGINTIGAWGQEAFELRFKNNTYQKIQVKLSVDGTDVFSGQTADTNVSDKMWVVNGYDTLSLKAWPENNNGGAAFVFTSADNSVALHTHGDLSSRGIIAAAVFVEGHVEPIRYYQSYYPIYVYPNHYWYGSGCCGTVNTPTWMGSITGTTTISSGTIQTNQLTSNTLGSISQNSCSFNSAAPASDITRSLNLESLAAVGAGQHVDQKISYVAGLIKPVFSEAVRVRYIWWDDLVSELKSSNVPAPHASGFPGDREQGIKLGGTPRLSAGGSFRRAEATQYSRV